jgi:hypothetical protein
MQLIWKDDKEVGIYFLCRDWQSMTSEPNLVTGVVLFFLDCVCSLFAVTALNCWDKHYGLPSLRMFIKWPFTENVCWFLLLQIILTLYCLGTSISLYLKASNQPKNSQLAILKTCQKNRRAGSPQTTSCPLSRLSSHLQNKQAPPRIKSNAACKWVETPGKRTAVQYYGGP